MATPQPIKLVTGQQSWAGGVDSSKTPTIASDGNPNGLRVDQLAWLSNATVRGGGIYPRGGLRRLLQMPVKAAFQGGVMYDVIDGYPYIMVQIGGRTYQVRVDTDNSVVDLSAVFGLTMPPLVPKGFMQQGEQFLVIQAGDYTTLPLFWDGASLIRSIGFTPPSGTLPNPSFTVPAVGSPVLVTLTAPYAGTTNQIFNINGYRYQQVLFNQRYGVTSFITTQGAAFTTPFTLPFLDNQIIPAVGGGAGATVLSGFGLNFIITNSGASANSFGTSGDNRFFAETNLSAVANHYGYATLAIPNNTANGQVNITSLNHNNLATPGVNQVWLLNLDDVRTGTVITTRNSPPLGRWIITKATSGSPMGVNTSRATRLEVRSAAAESMTTPTRFYT